MTGDGAGPSAGGCPVQHQPAMSLKPTGSAQPPSAHHTSQTTVSDGGCPVQHSNSKVPEGCPVQHSTSSSSSSDAKMAQQNPFASIHRVVNPTPVHTRASYNEAANDVTFSSTTSEFPKDQKNPLNTQRSLSTIPKSDFTPGHQPQGFENWVYPSGKRLNLSLLVTSRLHIISAEQQYFNAMKRKGYDPHETDVPVILSIHNLVNEQGIL
jgi:cytochrome c heme-lyase